jgi:hypothetical protein
MRPTDWTEDELTVVPRRSITYNYYTKSSARNTSSGDQTFLEIAQLA